MFFFQVLISLLVLNLLHLLGLVPLKPVSCSLAEKLLVPSICGSILTVLSLWAQANGSSSGLFSVTLLLLPLLTAAFSFILKLSTPPSAHVCVLVSMLSGTCLVAAGERRRELLVLQLRSSRPPSSCLLLSLSLFSLQRCVRGGTSGEPLRSSGLTAPLSLPQLAPQSI